ncbi:MAG: tetratricopeptide repeat protein [Dysgonomonas sp.]|nr:tetratricopeptide repeat protein [Dysgonomonas sp.]
MTRFYHSTNTRYNIHFNANEAYKEGVKSKYDTKEDNLSQMLYIFPDNSDSTAMQSPGGNFSTTIEKSAKAIKLHSIKTRPKRDPKRRNDKDYQAWLQQREYTPFMDQVWLLLAKAEFQEANYLRAITTFMYITKIYSSNPNIVAECQLWIARAYTEMGWMYEAGNILHKMELAGGAPKSQQTLFAEVKGNYLIRNNEYEAAIPFVEYAIKRGKDKQQKLRMKYLLGQLYLETGDKTKAEKAFGAVQGMNTPYNYTFNAKLQQAQLKSSEDAVRTLTKMAKSSKNKEYQDQLYTAIGNIYLNKTDTLKAIDNYRAAIKESTRNGYDKAMAQVKLGDIYFNKKEFIPAQPNYSEALPQLKRSHEDYPRVAFRSAILDELVIHAKVVVEQDSLQHLAQLPEAERLVIINKKIEELKKEEKEKQRAEERLKLEEERTNRVSSWSDLESLSSRPQTTATIGQQVPETPAFYFYNNQAVAQGKTAFQKQWGTRKLEDDWRRSDKSSFASFDSWGDDDTDASNIIDSLTLADGNKATPDSLANDIYSVEYYLQQLPLTEEALKASNVLVENALFNMGKIYKDKLGDMPLAIETFEKDMQRYPQTPNLEEIYYQLFLIYMQSGNHNMMVSYRNKLLTEFSQGQYATPLSDPNYEWNFRHFPLLQDSLYTKAYNAYKSADVQTIRENYSEMKNKYPFTDLMPKFTFLNALSYAQTRDISGLEKGLKEVTTEYPKADVTPLATEILERIKEGKVILSDGTLTDFDWSKAYVNDSILSGENGDSLAYMDNMETEHLLLFMFRPKTIDRNDLLFNVADYNFSNYVVQTFDLSYDSDPPYDILQMKGFSSFTTVKSYMNKAFAENGLMHKIDTTILVVPISIENYTKVFPRLGLEQYISFVKDTYKDQLPQLIAYWNREDIEATIDAEIGTSDIENIEAEQQEQITPEIKQEIVQPEEPKKEPEKIVNEKEINADELLTKDQLEKAGKVNDAIEKVEDIFNNPVDGIKNIFKKNNYQDNLTKEEKEAIKQEQKLEKERQKEQKAIEKARLDSINKIEKAKTDSIAKAEKAVQDSIKSAEKQRQLQLKLEEEQKKNAAKAAIKEKEEARKQKEQQRKEKERLQKERLRQKEKERKEKEKAREKERQEKEKQAEQRRKEKQKSQD